MFFCHVHALAKRLNDKWSVESENKARAFAGKRVRLGFMWLTAHVAFIEVLWVLAEKGGW